MSEELKTEDQKRIEKMDKVADSLLDLIGKEGTSEAQKGRLFAQVQSWYKLRPTLLPDEGGGKLEEMSHGIKSKGNKRNGSTGSSGGRVAKDGRAIRDIIKTLPKFGAGASAQVGSGHDRGVDGDPKGSERESGGSLGDGRSILPNGGRNGAGHDDEPGHSSVV